MVFICLSHMKSLPSKTGCLDLSSRTYTSHLDSLAVFFQPVLEHASGSRLTILTQGDRFIRRLNFVCSDRHTRLAVLLFVRWCHLKWHLDDTFGASSLTGFVLRCQIATESNRKHFRTRTPFQSGTNPVGFTIY